MELCGWSGLGASKGEGAPRGWAPELAQLEGLGNQFIHDMRVTRATRGRSIASTASEFKRDWTSSVARILDETCAALPGEAHLRQDTPRFDEEGLTKVLGTTAGSIRLLLSCSNGSREQ